MAKSIFALNRALTPEELITRRRTMVRLGLAWLVMMQVMMFALPGYLRQDTFTHDNLDVLDWAIFLLNWASLALTIPVIIYSAWPIWVGTLNAMSQRRVTMDVPVAISMITAFVPSFWATLQGQGEVYFDSVTMFVAFLLTARFFEMRARQSVDSVQHSKALESLCGPLIGQADRIAMWFVVIQLSIAVLVGAYWWMAEPALALPVMVSLFVMSCPCALSLSAPVSLAATHATLAAYPDMSVAQTQRLFSGARRITRQNLYGSLIFHLITTPLAAVGLVTPWLAALAMFVSSVAVAANAWRLYREPAQGLARGGDSNFVRT
jgi:cation transport ATPase